MRLLLIAALALACSGPAFAADATLQRQAALVPPAAAHPAEAIDIGALTLDSDFTPFMRGDCPEPVRRRALRKLWTLLPQGVEDGPTTF